RIYLGHDQLFKFAGAAEIVLAFDFAAPGLNPAGAAVRQRPLLLDWEYLSTDGWLPLTLVEDRTQRFTRDGKVTLAKVYGPDAKDGVVAGQMSFWIRATVSDRVPQARVATEPAGYLVRYAPSVLVAFGDQVRISGEATGAHVIALGEGYLVVDAKLAGFNRDALLEKASGTPLRRVIRMDADPPGSRVAYAPVKVGDQVGIQSGSTDLLSKARVLALGEGRMIVAAPLQGAHVNATLASAGGVVLGSIVSALPYFRIAVENPRD